MSNRCIQVCFLLSFLTLALPSNAAEEKVWSCEMTGFTSSTPGQGLENHENERFKFKVTPTEVILRSDGYLGRLSVEMINFYGIDNFNAGNNYVVVVFDDRKFNYASANFEGAVAISAKCEDF